MAYDEKTKRSNSDNCEAHIWPRHYGGSFSSIGRVDYMQCNNCLAMRIIFSTDVRVAGEWIRVTQTQVVEPTFEIPEVK